MADYEVTLGENLPEDMVTRWAEVGDGTHALVRAAYLDSTESAGPLGSIRKSRRISVTIPNGQALSDKFDFRDVAGAIIHMPSSWTTANVGFQVCDTLDGKFLPLYDETNSIVEVSSAAADYAYVVPADVFAARYVRLWSQDGSGGDTNQGADRVIEVSLKA